MKAFEGSEVVYWRTIAEIVGLHNILELDFVGFWLGGGEGSEMSGVEKGKSDLEVFR